MKEIQKSKGLHQKYVISKRSGEQVDDNAEYFVLRLDYSCNDQRHVDACRKAVLKYAEEINPHLPELSKDLLLRYNTIESATKIQNISQSDFIEAGFMPIISDPIVKYEHVLLSIEDIGDVVVAYVDSDLYSGFCIVDPQGIFMYFKAETPFEAIEWANKIIGYEPNF